MDLSLIFSRLSLIFYNPALIPHYMKRALFIAPTPYFSNRGCHVRIMGLARAAKALGYSADLVTYHIGDDYGPFEKIYRIKGLEGYDYRGPGPTREKIVLDMEMLGLVRKLLQKNDYHVVHGFLHEAGAMFKLLRRPKDTKLVLDLQGLMAREMLSHGYMKEGGIKHRFWKAVEGLSLGKEIDITVSSPMLDESLREKYRLGENRITVLLDGVDTDHFHPLEGTEARKDPDIGADTVVFGYLGGLLPGKGAAAMLRAYKIAREELDIKNKLVVGGYPGEGRIKKLGTKLGLDSHLVLRGEVPYLDAPHFLSVFDIGISPKIGGGEGAQGKNLSYMACGIPVIAYDYRYNRDLMGDAGIYFSNEEISVVLAEQGKECKGKLYSDNIEAMAMEMVTAAKMAPEERKKRGKDLRQRALGHSWEERASLLESVYQA